MKEPTKICKICFEEIKLNSLRTLINKNNDICDKCFNKFQSKFIHFKIDKVEGLSIYEYDEYMKTFIYQLKGCFDVELADLFLNHYINYLNLEYHGYYVVPIPSYELEDKVREFNHVIEMFKNLKLKRLDILHKTEKYKQSDHKASERHLISKYLKVSDLELVRNKKLLIVDDIVTTGSTLKAAIALLKEGKPKIIKILTIAKRVLH